MSSPKRLGELITVSKVKINLHAVFYLVLIMLVSILVLFKAGLVGSGGIANPGDTGFHFFPEHVLRIMLTLWEARVKTGMLFPLVGTQIPIMAVLAILERIGLSGVSLNHLWFIFALTLQGWAAYYFVSVFLTSKHKQVIAFLCALAYMLSPLNYNLIMGSINIMYSKAATVFALAFYIRGLEEKDLFNRYSILFAVALAFSATDPVSFGMAIAIIVSYFLFRIFLTRKNIRTIVLFTVLALGLVSLLNLSWISGFIADTFTAGKGMVESYLPNPEENIGVLQYLSQFTQTSNIIRLVRGVDVRDTSGLQYYILSPTLILGTFILLIVTFGLLLKRNVLRIYKNSSYFLLLAIFSILLVSGSRPPLGHVFTLLWNYLPGFQVFRNPLKFFWPGAIAYTYLFAVSLEISYSWIEGKVHSNRFLHRLRASTLLSVALVAILLMYSWPFFSKSLANILGPSKLPQYYLDVRRYLLLQKEDSRIFVLPIINWNLKYTWSKTDMSDILLEFSPKPLVFNPTSYSLDHKALYNKKVYQLYSEGKFNIATRLLSLKNVEYVLLREDLDEDYGGTRPRLTIPTATLKELIDSRGSESLKLEKLFGKLNLYKISDEYFLPHIYASPDETSL